MPLKLYTPSHKDVEPPQYTQTPESNNKPQVTLKSILQTLLLVATICMIITSYINIQTTLIDKLAISELDTLSVTEELSTQASETINIDPLQTTSTRSSYQPLIFHPLNLIITLLSKPFTTTTHPNLSIKPPYQNLEYSQNILLLPKNSYINDINDSNEQISENKYLKHLSQGNSLTNEEVQKILSKLSPILTSKIQQTLPAFASTSQNADKTIQNAQNYNQPQNYISPTKTTHNTAYLMQIPYLKTLGF